MKRVLFGCVALFGTVLLVGCGGDKKVEERVAQIQTNTPASSTTDANASAATAAVATAAPSGVEGKQIFSTRCAACHGQNGEGKASYPKLAGLTKDDVLKMLKGYVDGTYGKAQKGIMAGQAKGIDDRQKAAVAEYIATLK